MGVKISELQEKTTANGTDIIPVVDTDGTKKIKLTTILSLIFPIGSTYITQTDSNPSEILKFGTWERLKGKVCVGLDEDDTDFNEIGKTGGEKTHTLTVAEMPNHAHPYINDSKFGVEAGASGMCPTWGPVKGTTGATTGSAGGGQSHNNLQPYKVVGYMWIRTA